MDNNSNNIDIYTDINIFNCTVDSVGVAKHQSDLKRSFSQIYQIDLSIFVDRSERSERVEKERSHCLPLHLFITEVAVVVWSLAHAWDHCMAVYNNTAAAVAAAL